MFETEGFPAHAFDSVVATFTALLKHEAGRPDDLTAAMRNAAALQSGLDEWARMQARIGPTAAEKFSAAHAFLARVIHEGAHLKELERSFREARRDLERDRSKQVRILEDSHSLELANVASSNNIPSDELIRCGSIHMTQCAW